MVEIMEMSREEREGMEEAKRLTPIIGAVLGNSYKTATGMLSIIALQTEGDGLKQLVVSPMRKEILFGWGIKDDAYRVAQELETLTGNTYTIKQYSH